MINFFYITPPVAASVFRVYFDMIAHVYDKLTLVQIPDIVPGYIQRTGTNHRYKRAVVVTSQLKWISKNI